MGSGAGVELVTPAGYAHVAQSAIQAGHPVVQVRGAPPFSLPVREKSRTPAPGGAAPKPDSGGPGAGGGVRRDVVQEVFTRSVQKRRSEVARGSQRQFRKSHSNSRTQECFSLRAVG
ncbi:hypothetical protein GCM10010350_21420 [Streptomyces galilaeus]|nr:hypothetical protein GCM10010350_21420 [Streptomyces galilaeus]